MNTFFSELNFHRSRDRVMTSQHLVTWLCSRSIVVDTGLNEFKLISRKCHLASWFTFAITLKNNAVNYLSITPCFKNRES